MHFWAPDTDPVHPMDCTQPERYVLQRLKTQGFLAIAADGVQLVDVETSHQAHWFHTHEAALRAALELNAEGRGPFDVVKLEVDVL